MKIAIIDYGAGNTKSVKYALERIGYSSELTRDANTIINADKVIFPGIGEASSAMLELQNSGLNKIIPTLKQPVLGICLGMQLMCGHTTEGDIDGLNIFPINVVRFNSSVKVPKVGWNNIFDLKGDLFTEICELDFTYFVHSFYAPLSEFTVAKANYDINYSAALKKDNFYGCQFHPEKSSKIGEHILRNFINL
jgi:glutamine amidotransferase